MSDPHDVPQWKRLFTYCGSCWLIRLLWVKGNVGYCEECRPDWRPGAQIDGSTS